MVLIFYTFVGWTKQYYTNDLEGEGKIQFRTGQEGPKGE